MTVTAECHDCGNTHKVADRSTDPDTAASTVCPQCESPSYTSSSNDDYDLTVAELLVGVRGVGEQIEAELQARYDAYELQAASVEELCQVPHVGERTAQNIKEAV